MSAPVVRVAAAVLIGSNGDVLLAQRPAGKAFAGYWEFPGGKLESGETPQTALVRELREELGIEVTRATKWLVADFTYPHARVELHFFRVFAWKGELHGHDGQDFVWQTPGDYTVGPLLPANTRILAALTLPPVYGISCADELGEDEFLRRAEAALAGGLRLMVLREKSWTAAQRAALAARLLPLVRAHRARLLVTGDADEARALGCDGVHWTAATLLQAIARPRDLLVAASCHDAAELAHAGALELDFAMLGPVAATPTHPDAVPLGWPAFAAIAAEARLPVYALGGLEVTDFDAALDHGAQGLALRRGAWPA